MSMARYNVRHISKGKGHNLIEYASYLTGRVIYDKANRRRVFRSGKRAKRVVLTKIYSPTGAPHWTNDIESLVNKIQENEKRKDATFVLEVLISFPAELTHDQRVAYVDEFVRKAFVSIGRVTTAHFHNPEPELTHDKSSEGGLHRKHGADLNHHVHLLVTLRTVDKHGFSMKKNWECNRAWLLENRALCETLLNEHLRMNGHNVNIGLSYSNKGPKPKIETKDVTPSPKGFLRIARTIPRDLILEAPIS